MTAMPTVPTTVVPTMAAVMAVVSVMAMSESEDNARAVAVSVIVTHVTMTPPMTVAPMAVAIWSVMDLLSDVVSLMYLCSGGGDGRTER